MVGSTARHIRWIAGFAAGSLLSAVPASAGTHKILWSPNFKEVWVGARLKVKECRQPSYEALTSCPNFRAVSHSGYIDMDGKLVYIVQLTNSQFVKVERVVGKYDVLPNGSPIVLIPPK